MSFSSISVPVDCSVQVSGQVSGSLSEDRYVSNLCPTEQLLSNTIVEIPSSIMSQLSLAIVGQRATLYKILSPLLIHRSIATPVRVRIPACWKSTLRGPVVGGHHF